jgi:hypothetical protein
MEDLGIGQSGRELKINFIRKIDSNECIQHVMANRRAHKRCMSIK